jgi:3-oxoacyl-[acyl-carrier protein] reductase
MKISFDGLKILVTGGTRGIGAELANAFREADAQVTVTGTKGANTKDFFRVDFSVKDELSKFLGYVETQAFDVVVNNAGINRIAKFENIETDDFDKIQTVNVRAPFLITQAAWSGMKNRKFGRVLFISSVFASVSKEKRACYSTSKSALLGLMRAIAIEGAQENILVNSISPGFFQTDLTEAILGKEQIEQMTGMVPSRRLGQPKEIAPLALLLSSRENTFITGQDHVIDGGFTCG